MARKNNFCFAGQLQSFKRHWLLLLFLLFFWELPRRTDSVQGVWNVPSFAEVESRLAFVEPNLAERTEGLKYKKERRKLRRRAGAVVFPGALLLCIIAVGLNAGIAKKKQVDAEAFVKAVEARKESDAVMARLERLNALKASATRLAVTVGTRQALRVLAAVNKNLETGEQLRQDLEGRRKLSTGRNLLRLENEFRTRIERVVDNSVKLIQDLRHLADDQNAKELIFIKNLEHTGFWLRHAESAVRHVAGKDCTSALKTLIGHIDRGWQRSFVAAEAAREWLVKSKSFETEEDEDALIVAARCTGVVKKNAAQVQPVLDLIKTATYSLQNTALRDTQNERIQLNQSLMVTRLYWDEMQKACKNPSPETKEMFREVGGALSKAEALLHKHAESITLISSTDDAKVIVDERLKATAAAEEARGAIMRCAERFAKELDFKRINLDTKEVRDILARSFYDFLKEIHRDSDEAKAIAAEVKEGTLNERLHEEISSEGERFCKFNKFFVTGMLKAAEEAVQNIEECDARAGELLNALQGLDAYEDLSRLAAQAVSESVKSGDARTTAEGIRMRNALLIYLTNNITETASTFQVVLKRKYKAASFKLDKLVELESLFAKANESIKKATSLHEVATAAGVMKNLLDKLQIFNVYSAIEETAL